MVLLQEIITKLGFTTEKPLVAFLPPPLASNPRAVLLYTVPQPWGKNNAFLPQFLYPTATVPTPDFTLGSDGAS